MIHQYHLVFLSLKELTPEAIIINSLIIAFIMLYESIFFSARKPRIVNMERLA